MFAPNVVGTANATAAGWGNLGGGVTQIFMMSVLFNPMVGSGLEPNVAWRASMIVPAVMFVICAICMKLLCNSATISTTLLVSVSVMLHVT